MPELPEVESLVRKLRAPLIGRRISSVVCNWSRTLVNRKPAEFARTLSGSRFCSVERRGKFLIFTLAEKKSSTSSCLIVHLRMSGNLTVSEADEPVSKYDRVIFNLDDGKKLRFSDTRKFGRMYLVSHHAAVVGKLGPEPLDEAFTAESFRARLKGKKRIKAALLDQTVIAGIGNIYADEALWRAGIHPGQALDSLSLPQVNSLFRAIRAVLNAAIKNSGTDFGDGVVPYGGYEPKVYGRTGKPCKKCKTLIEKTTVAQRGTHFCPKCQPLPRKSKNT
jgi:formamidopyrimidine-DNA glycosylase